jgi:tape measure domain-containing protein
MIQEEIARLTGKLVFQVDNRPLMAFEKRLNSVIDQLRQLETLANKKFNIKVQLDSRTLREQLAKASAAKVTLKDVHVSQEALALAAKRITDKLDSTPITLNKIRVDIASLIQTKKLVRTLLGQMEISIPLKFQTSAADKMLRAWKKETEAKFKLKIDADISQHKFIQNVRKSLASASLKLGPVKIETPNIKLNIDRDHLKQEIRDVLAQIRRETTIRINLRDESPSRRSSANSDRSARGHAFGGGLMGAGMGFARGALPGLGAAFAIGAVNQINQQLVATNTALEAVSGSAEGYASNLKFLEDLTQEQGRNMRDVAPQFNSILASAQGAIGNEGTQDLFRGVMKYGTVMGLDQEAMKGSLRAISQMFSKDKIQAEEAQGQLAERLPAAMQLLAQANGTDVKGLREQMQKGSLDPKKILPQMAKIMEELAEKNGAYAKALESTRVAQGRMNRQFERSVRIFAEGGFDKGIRDFFTSMADGMQKSAPLVTALGGAFDLLMRPINALIGITATIGANWTKIADVFGISGKALATLAGIAAVAALPFGTVALAIAGVALAVEDLMVYMEGGDSMFGRFLESSPEAKAALEGFTTEAKQFGEYLQLAVTNALELVTGLQGLSVPEMFINTMRELQTILKLFNDTVDRFVAAGQYAQMMAPEGGLSANLANMRAMANGPEWARQQMSDKVAGEFASQGVGAELPGGVSLTADQIGEAVARAIGIQAAEGQQRRDYFEANINVDVKGGVVSAGDLMTALNEPMKQIAIKAFGEVVNNERNSQSQVRQ